MKESRRFVWLVLLIFILAMLMLYCLPGPRNGRFAQNQHTSEIMLSACFFSFVSLMYFIPRIDRLWKVPVYGILTTSLCLLVFGFSVDLTHVLDGKPIEMLFRGHYNLSRLRHILTELLVFSVSFNIAPLAVLCPYFYLQKRISQKTNNYLSSSKDWASKITFPRNIKLTLFAAAIYIVFIVVYDMFVRPKKGPMIIYNNIPTGENFQLRLYILGYVFVLYFISFFSLLISMPSLIGRVKKGIAYCVLTPMFWSITILAVYALLIFFTTWNTEFFREDIFTLNYYLGRYFDTRAWFISFPLLAIWGFCHWLVKTKQDTRGGSSVTNRTAEE